MPIEESQNLIKKLLEDKQLEIRIFHIWNPKHNLVLNSISEKMKNEGYNEKILINLVIKKIKKLIEELKLSKQIIGIFLILKIAI